MMLHHAIEYREDKATKQIKQEKTKEKNHEMSQGD